MEVNLELSDSRFVSILNKCKKQKKDTGLTISTSALPLLQQDGVAETAN